MHKTIENNRNYKLYLLWKFILEGHSAWKRQIVKKMLLKCHSSNKNITLPIILGLTLTKWFSGGNWNLVLGGIQKILVCRGRMPYLHHQGEPCILYILYMTLFLLSELYSIWFLSRNTKVRSAKIVQIIKGIGGGGGSWPKYIGDVNFTVKGLFGKFFLHAI